MRKTYYVNDQPLVSIVIPTLNSEKTLPLTLESIKKQTYKNIEIIIVDSYSKDNTIKIAKEYGARIVQTRGGLLWARYLGHKHVRGEIEVLLDSDQILSPDAIEQSVRKIKNGYDMLILEEKSYSPRTLLQWFFYFDRVHIHRIRDIHYIHGVLLARVYKYEIIDKAFINIVKRLPLDILYKLVSQDHALIYYEAWRARGYPKIDIIPNAVYHIEPASFKQLIRKFYRYGRTELNITYYYPELSRKISPRKINTSFEALISLILWMLKAVPYALGKFVARR